MEPNPCGHVFLQSDCNLCKAINAVTHLIEDGELDQVRELANWLDDLFITDIFSGVN